MPFTHPPPPSERNTPRSRSRSRRRAKPQVAGHSSLYYKSQKTKQEFTKKYLNTRGNFTYSSLPIVSICFVLDSVCSRIIETLWTKYPRDKMTSAPMPMRALYLYLHTTIGRYLDEVLHTRAEAECILYSRQF